MAEPIKSFEDLECWKVGRDVRNSISKLAKELPSNEKYRLIDQIIRASRSITNNVAEGYGRYHFQENAQFCRQARGSLTELKDHLIIALDEGYIDEKRFKNEIELVNKAEALLNGYIRYLINAKKNHYVNSN